MSSSDDPAEKEIVVLKAQLKAEKERANKLVDAVKALLIEVRDLNNESADDGDGHIDVWQSPELEFSIIKTDEALAEYQKTE